MECVTPERPGIPRHQFLNSKFIALNVALDKQHRGTLQATLESQYYLYHLLVTSITNVTVLRPGSRSPIRVRAVIN